MLELIHSNKSEVKSDGNEIMVKVGFEIYDELWKRGNVLTRTRRRTPQNQNIKWLTLTTLLMVVQVVAVV
jgi:hypothetical protein